MNREELIGLADRILRKEASEADIKAYNAWYNSFQESGEILVTDEEEKKAVLYARILAGIEGEVVAPEPGFNVVRRKIGTWAAIAAAVAAIAFGIYFFSAPLNPDKGSQMAQVPKVKDIPPGRNTAKLVLENGKSIDLSDKKTGVVIDLSGLKYNDDTKIGSIPVRGGKSGLLSVVTPRGGTYQVILSDGSKIWLNAASSIRFPASFAGQKQRSVEITGEVYFEIFKNKKQKFVVTTKNQQVEVLGTHFNINSYPEEGEVKTTLLEGSVRVSSLRNNAVAAHSGMSEKEEVMLVPGQQSVVSESSPIEVKAVDLTDVIAWKEGKFIFVRENVQSVMNKIARWYNVEIVYEGDVNKALGGSVSRFKNVSEVLAMLSETKAVQFRIEGRKVIVMPYKNKK